MQRTECLARNRLATHGLQFRTCCPAWTPFAFHAKHNFTIVWRRMGVAFSRLESRDAQVSTSSSSPASSERPSHSPGLLQRGLSGSPEWAGFLGTLANSGATTGTLLDGIHSRMGLQVYDMAPIVLGGLKTSVVVPPLLALFYVVLGTLHPVLDNLNPGDATSAVRGRSVEVGFVALAFGVLAALLQLSATLYDMGVPYWQIHMVLGSAALLNWRLFDGTRQGIWLALLCGMGAPAIEVVMLQVVPLWHYPRADLGGVFVSWVFWCYFFYTPALGSLARYLWFTMQEAERYGSASDAVSALGVTSAAAAVTSGSDADPGGVAAGGGAVKETPSE